MMTFQMYEVTRDLPALQQAVRDRDLATAKRTIDAHLGQDVSLPKAIKIMEYVAHRLDLLTYIPSNYRVAAFAPEPVLEDGAPVHFLVWTVGRTLLDKPTRAASRQYFTQLSAEQDALRLRKRRPALVRDLVLAPVLAQYWGLE